MVYLQANFLKIGIIQCQKRDFPSSKSKPPLKNVTLHKPKGPPSPGGGGGGGVNPPAPGGVGVMVD